MSAGINHRVRATGETVCRLVHPSSTTARPSRRSGDGRLGDQIDSDRLKSHRQIEQSRGRPPTRRIGSGIDGAGQYRARTDNWRLLVAELSLADSGDVAPDEYPSRYCASRF